MRASFVGLLFATLLAATGAGATEPFQCEGGGGMTATTGTDGLIRILFKFADHGFSQGGLQPGECSWQSRGFANGDPAMLIYSSFSPNANLLLQAANAGGTIRMQAFNNNQGALVLASLEQINVFDSAPLSPGPTQPPPPPGNDSGFGAGIAAQPAPPAYPDMSDSGSNAMGGGVQGMQTARVIKDVNLRSAPKNTSKVIRSLHHGIQIFVAGCNPNWCQVVLKDGSGGWVSKPYIRFEGGDDVAMMPPDNSNFPPPPPMDGGMGNPGDMSGGGMDMGGGGFPLPPMPPMNGGGDGVQSSGVPNIAGEWDSNTDKGWSYRISLQQDGKTVTGTYVSMNGDAGTMNGQVNNQTFMYYWTLGTFKGTGYFTINGSTMEGRYSTKEHPDDPNMDPYYMKGLWSAERAVNDGQQMGGSGGKSVVTSVANIAGTWSVLSDKDWTYTFYLSQTDNQVSGSYTAQDGSQGTIHGTVQGQTFTYKWTAAGGYAGSGQFNIGPDSLEGAYDTQTYPDPNIDPYYLTGTWKATRVQ